MSREFHKLRVIEVRDEIKNARTVMFEVPADLEQVFRWRAGQHLTLRIRHNDEELRRSYSISSSPFSGDPLRITVKRVKGGRISNYINDHVKVGDQLDVMPAFGSFCLDPQENARRTHYFFGAGSGVTPLFSMLHSVLLVEPHSDVRFAYGNASAKTIIFNKMLSQLANEHSQRLTVAHALSETSIWSGQDYWRKGRLDKESIETFINENPPYAQDAQYYICGPGGMNKAVKATLMALDVPGSRIHMESYGGTVETDDSVTGVPAEAQIALKNKSHQVSIAAGQTILEAVRALGLEPPFSCQSGVCGACRATLKKGTVHMRARMALEDDEITQGAVLTCQALAASSELELHYE